MCGLVGVMGDINKNEMVAFEQLLWIDTVRGRDNTGVFSVGLNGGIDSLKVQGDASSWFMHRKSDAVLGWNKCLIVGHNRAMTRGTNNARNAHPFEFDNIIGVHNGTLSHATKNILEGSANYGTDSEALFSHLNANTLQDTVSKMVASDAYALVWYDKKQDQLNFARNGLRPFFYTFTDDNKTMFWASEKPMLYMVLNRLGIKFNKVFNLKENKHLVFDVPNPNTPIAYPTITNIKPAPEPAPVTYYRTGKDYEKSYFKAIGQAASKPADPIIAEQAARKGLLQMSTLMGGTGGGHPYYLGHSGSFDPIFEQDFYVLAANGCVVCESSPIWGEPVKFLKDNMIVCSKCMTDQRPDVMAVIQDYL